MRKLDEQREILYVIRTLESCCHPVLVLKQQSTPLGVEATESFLRTSLA